MSLAFQLLSLEVVTSIEDRCVAFALLPENVLVIPDKNYVKRSMNKETGRRHIAQCQLPFFLIFFKIIINRAA